MPPELLYTKNCMMKGLNRLWQLTSFPFFYVILGIMVAYLRIYELGHLSFHMLQGALSFDRYRCFE